MLCLGLVLLSSGAMVPCASWVLEGGIWAAVGELLEAQARACDEHGLPLDPLSPLHRVSAEELAMFAQAIAQVAFNFFGYALAPVAIGAALDAALASVSSSLSASFAEGDWVSAGNLAADALWSGLRDNLFLALPLLSFLAVGMLALMAQNRLEAQREEVARAVYLTTGVWRASGVGAAPGAGSPVGGASASVSTSNTIRAQLSVGAGSRRAPLAGGGAGGAGGGGADASLSMVSVNGAAAPGTGSVPGALPPTRKSIKASSRQTSLSQLQQQQPQQQRSRGPQLYPSVTLLAPAASPTASPQPRFVAGPSPSPSSNSRGTPRAGTAPAPTSTPVMDWSRRGSVLSFETSSIDAPVSFDQVPPMAPLPVPPPPRPPIVPGFPSASGPQAAATVMQGLALSVPPSPLLVTSLPEALWPPMLPPQLQLTVSADAALAAGMAEEETEQNSDDDNFMLYGRAMQDE